jgi:hypothetical protein
MATPAPARSLRPRAGALIAVVIAVGVIVWLLVRGGDDGDKPAATTAPAARAPQRSAPEKTSIAALRKLAAASGHSIFWARPAKGVTYELSRTNDGSIYIRYLPAGVKLGDPRPNFLTVGSYPLVKPFATVQSAAKKQGAIVRKLSHGGLAVTNSDRPTSVYFAYPSSTVLVEVYDRTPGRARELVTSGRIEPIR